MSPSGLKSAGFSPPHQGGDGSPPNRIFDGKRQLVVQIVLVACCGIASCALGGIGSGQSSLAGSAAAIAGTLAFQGVLRWRNRLAPTAWEALRLVIMAEIAKWAVSLLGLASLLLGWLVVDAVSTAPGAAVIGFCVAWAAPLLALVKRN
jgi:hypothetical protein